jgi:exodeoxyribonuclease VII large subunit
MVSKMESPTPRFSVSDFIAVSNQVLEMSFPGVEVEGEVASFKVNQNKYVFFDLKDDGGSVGCFMTVWQLRVALEDGMKVVVRAVPKLTPWGKFSLTVQAVRPSGEGSLKKNFELLKAKLEKEGLFASERKRTLPARPQHVAVISSTQAAGYADFIKILNDRWGGLQVDVAHVQVQGIDAPDQMIRALEYFNTREVLPEVIVLIRGGGSADDLSAFNDEKLVREVAASRVPTLVGVGHEVDVSLSDLAADVRAATPSNAAQLLVPDRREVVRSVRQRVTGLLPRIQQTIQQHQGDVRGKLEQAFRAISHAERDYELRFEAQRKVLAELNPYKVLARGYALVRGTLKTGETIEIEKSDRLISAEVKDVRKK